ncbi:serine/threonine-protein kinase [Streptomyces sp. ALB3]|uniref:serine/threonine-protein kinase n=1 Tax=Streptomyces sp. ALB3 TaxID=3374278 RepID=UPI0037A0B7D4
MTSTPSASHLEPLGPGDPASVGGYRLVAVLGTGGMGKVYLSYTPGGRPLAIKVIRPEFGEDPEFRRRFRQEVQAAQRVQGLYTAPVIDFDTDSSQPWLATAYVPGPSLAHAVTGHGRLPLRSSLLLAVGVAEALHVIHGAGIVHRDLKPANVLLASDGPRVIDFGIARAADTTALTSTGVSVGTPAFMAPEQASAGTVGPATDIFALGQIVAFAAIGSPAYGGGPSHALLYRIVHEDPDLTQVPAELLPLVSRCLTRDPAGRPSLTEIIELCHELSPVALRQGEDWLPQAVAASITERLRLPGPVRTAEPQPPATPTPTLYSPPRHSAPGRAAGPNAPTGPGQATQPTQTARRAPGAVPPPPGYPMHPAPPQGHRTPPPGFPAPQTLPRQPRKQRTGLIVAGAIVGTVIVLGVIRSLLPDGSGDDRGDKSPTTGASGSSAASDGVPGKADPKPVTYKGISLPQRYYLMLADSPPRPSAGGSGTSVTDGDLYLQPKTLNVVESDEIRSGDARMVLLDNAQEGSLERCRTETRFTKEIRLDQLSDGSRFCVLSDAGHIAVVTYRGRSGSNDPSTYVDLDLTIWRNAELPQKEQ